MRLRLVKACLPAYVSYGTQVYQFMYMYCVESLQLATFPLRVEELCFPQIRSHVFSARAFTPAFLLSVSLVNVFKHCTNSTEVALCDSAD